MNIESRHLTPEISRLLADEKKMCFIAGPRQVGKTTLARYLLETDESASAYVNWDVTADRRLMIRHPEDFWLRKTTATGGAVRLALDEIHKFPRWKNFLKGLHDGHRNELQIIVTGSGKLDVYQRGGDSLFGRYHLYHLHPFTLGEMLGRGGPGRVTPDNWFGQILDSRPTPEVVESLEKLERFTGFPEPLFAQSEARLRRWNRMHDQLIVREELRDLTRIRELGLIESLILMLPERIGSPLSINALREDLGVRFETVQNWLGALSRLFFLFSIRPYAGRLARTLRREEKVYLFDFSVVEQPGQRFENLIALHLLKLCSMWTEVGHGSFELHYVRDREKREVDFLIARDRKPFALVEAKLTASEIDSSLRYFAARMKPRHALQIVRHPEKFKSAFLSQNILLAPAAQALAVM